MGSVTTEMRTAAAVVEESGVPAQAGPADEQVATAAAIAEALDPALVSRLAAQARTQGVARAENAIRAGSGPCLAPRGQRVAPADKS